MDYRDYFEPVVRDNKLYLKNSEDGALVDGHGIFIGYDIDGDVEYMYEPENKHGLWIKTPYAQYQIEPSITLAGIKKALPGINIRSLEWGEPRISEETQRIINRHVAEIYAEEEEYAAQKRRNMARKLTVPGNSSSLRLEANPRLRRIANTLRNKRNNRPNSGVVGGSRRTRYKRRSKH